MIIGKMRTKTCRACGQEKTIRNFYKHPNAVDGYMKVCRECHKVAIYENRSLKRDTYNAKRRIYSARPDVKAKRREYLSRPEVKAMTNENERIRRMLKREERQNVRK